MTVTLRLLARGTPSAVMETVDVGVHVLPILCTGVEAAILLIGLPSKGPTDAALPDSDVILVQS